MRFDASCKKMITRMITSISRRAQKKHEMNKGKKERDNAEKNSKKITKPTDRRTKRFIYYMRIFIGIFTENFS